jgi:hypothetical protein
LHCKQLSAKLLLSDSGQLGYSFQNVLVNKGMQMSDPMLLLLSVISILDVKVRCIQVKPTVSTVPQQMHVKVLPGRVHAAVMLYDSS